MTFQIFFQENIILFIALFVVVGGIIVLEWRERQTLGKTLTSYEASRLINEQATLIDLRSFDEYKKGHIAGAKNYPLSDFRNQFSRIKKDKPVILYCKNGLSSKNAAQILHENGYTEIYNLGGGYEAWVGEKLPVVMT